MSVPRPLLTYLESHTGLTVIQSQAVAGGSINQAAKLRTSQGTYFLKWNSSIPDHFFTVEEKGLRQLHEAGAGFRIPNVVATAPAEDHRPGFLLIEYIEPVRGSQKASEQFGEQLAGLHQTRASRFGLNYDNFIGSLYQSNRPHNSWNTFFIEERIEPQLKKAIDSEALPTRCRKGWTHLADRLDDIFPETEPSLLHGDLWSGNYFFDSHGQTVLIDPAIYYGHPEMELSFTRMFGGFSSRFYDAYASIRPLEPGFSNRIPMYNLYPILVHANLFGGSYARQADSFLRQYEPA